VNYLLCKNVSLPPLISFIFFPFSFEGEKKQNRCKCYKLVYKDIKLTKNKGYSNKIKQRKFKRNKGRKEGRKGKQKILEKKRGVK